MVSWYPGNVRPSLTSVPLACLAPRSSAPRVFPGSHRGELVMTCRLAGPATAGLARCDRGELALSGLGIPRCSFSPGVPLPRARFPSFCSGGALETFPCSPACQAEQGRPPLHGRKPGAVPWSDVELGQRPPLLGLECCPLLKPIAREAVVMDLCQCWDALPVLVEGSCLLVLLVADCSFLCTCDCARSRSLPWTYESCLSTGPGGRVV